MQQLVTNLTADQVHNNTTLHNNTSLHLREKKMQMKPVLLEVQNKPKYIPQIVLHSGFLNSL